MSHEESSTKDLPDPVPNPRSPGISRRRARVDRARAQVREQVRVESLRGELDFTEVELGEEAERRIDVLLEGQGKGVRKQYDKLAPTSLSIRRDGIVQLVEVAGIRRSKQLGKLGKLFQGLEGPRGPGRPSDRALPIAVFQRCALEMGRPSLRGNVEDFLGSNMLLDWAYDKPAETNGCGRHERSVLETMQAMLDRHDPVAAVALNIDAISEFAADHKDVARWLALDGTHVQGWLDQQKGYGEEHERLLNRDMTGTGFGTHGKHFWRGHTLLVLTCLKTTLPVAWILIPANRPEAKDVGRLLDLLYNLWPDCPVEYICADKGFDEAELHRTMEECYGIHLVTPWHRSKTDPPTPDLGTPCCHCTGVRSPMKLEQSEGFWPPKKRRAAGVAPGVRIDLKAKKAGFRWFCPDCGNVEKKRFHRDPRRHTFLPREGQHASRVDLRKALLIRRNAAESLFALLKHRGIAGRGVDTPRWARTDRHMDWLVGTALLGITLRRALHERGDYNALVREAFELELLKPLGHNRRLLEAVAA